MLQLFKTIIAWGNFHNLSVFIISHQNVLTFEKLIFSADVTKATLNMEV